MYIYKTTNLINNKIYIGLSTKSVEESTDYYGSGRLINEAIQKYGKDNFVKDILEDGIDDMNILKDREIYWIETLGSHVSLNNYNLTIGGDGIMGYHHTEEVKKALSENTSNSNKIKWKDPEYRERRVDKHKVLWQNSEFRERVINALHKPKTEEHKKNISIAKKDKPQSDKAKEAQRIVQKGMKYYYNPETKIKTRSKEELAHPWIKSSARTNHY